MKLSVLALVGGAAMLWQAQGLIAQNPAPEAAAIRKIAWRSIGPANMGGRVADIAGIPGDPKTFYVAPANGGLFKTTNGGLTFRSIFDAARPTIRSSGWCAFRHPSRHRSISS